MSEGEDEVITLQQVMDAYISLRNDVSGLAGAIQQDMEKVNFLIFHLLKDLGKITEMDCTQCEEEIVLPTFESAELETVCNLCGWSLIEDEEE